MKRKSTYGGRSGKQKKRKGWAGPLIRSGFNLAGGAAGGLAAGGATGGLAAGAGAVYGAKIGDGLYKAGRKIIKPVTRFFHTRSNSTRRSGVKGDTNGMKSRYLGLVKIGRRFYPQKVLGTYQVKNINQWVMQVAQGLQVADFPEVMCTRNQLTGLVTSANRTERYTWHDNPFQLNPYYARPASALYTAITGVSRNDLLYLKNCRTTFEMLSMSKLPQKVVVYWLMPKYDTDINPIDAWNNIIAGKNEGQSAATVASTTAVTSVAAGTAASTNIGANPFHHREFRNMWQCVRKCNIDLQAGEQVNLRIDFKYEKVLSKVTLEENRRMQFLKGLSVFPLVIATAGMEGIIPVAGTSATEVTYGAPKVGVIVNELYTFGALPAPKQSTNRVYTGVVVGDTVEQEVLLNDDEAVINAGQEL